MQRPVPQPFIANTRQLWSGVHNGLRLEQFTGQGLFSRNKHNQTIACLNALLDFRIKVLTGNAALDARVDYTDANVQATIDLSQLGGLTAGIAPYALKSVQDDYLTCRVLNDDTSEGDTDIYIAKPYKLRQSLTGVVEFGVTYKFFYAAPGGNLLGLDDGGTNVMRIKTSDPAQTTFPADVNSYDKDLGELQLVIPAWTPDVGAVTGDIIFGANVPNTFVVGPDSNPITILSVGDSRQWAKVDALVSEAAGNVVFYTGSDPTSDGLVPADTAAGAVAYSANGSGPTWSWDTSSSSWVLPSSTSSFSGSLALSDGVDSGSVTGLGLSFTPSRVSLSISRPSGSLMIFACDDAGTLSSDGFDFALSGLTDSSSYVLNYTLFP
jgi:hypothetical protein